MDFLNYSSLADTAEAAANNLYARTHLPRLFRPSTVNEEVEVLLSELSEISVPLAEFEYLYDAEAALEGQIDPNVLSAGGFPNLLSMLLDESKALRVPSEKDTRPFGALAADFVKRPAAELCSNFACHCFNYFGQSGREYLPYIEAALPQWQERLIESGWKGLDRGVDFLRFLLVKPERLLALDPRFYAWHRLSLIKEWDEIAEAGRGLGPFPAHFVSGCAEWLEHYPQVMDLNRPGVKGVSDFKVPWEADLGYWVAHWRAREGIPGEYTVWQDLHAGSGLFAVSPFSVLFSWFSGEQRDALYLLLRNSRLEPCEREAHWRLDGASLDYKESRLEVSTTAGQRLCFSDVKRAADILTPVFNQYGYLYELLPKGSLATDSPWGKRALLSSALNAKAVLFDAYEKQEKIHRFDIRRPPTVCSAAPSVTAADLETLRGPAVIAKIGHRFTSGGKNVSILTKPVAKEILPAPYPATVWQEFVPSHLFACNGQKLHGHVRVMSLLSESGHPIHAGYLVKLSLPGKGNSSAFTTFVLIFDSEGVFLTGRLMKRKPLTLDSLADASLEPLLKPKEWRAFLLRAKRNWLLSMLSLNQAFAGDIRDRVNTLVDEGLLDSHYRQEKGVPKNGKAAPASTTVMSLGR